MEYRKVVILPVEVIRMMERLITDRDVHWNDHVVIGPIVIGNGLEVDVVVYPYDHESKANGYVEASLGKLNHEGDWINVEGAKKDVRMYLEGKYVIYHNRDKYIVEIVGQIL